MLSEFPSPSELQGAVQGTLLYLTLYSFIFIPFQSFSKIYLWSKKKRAQQTKKDDVRRVSLKETKYYNARDSLALCGDRTVGNFLEQAICFLPIYWMHALWVDPTQSWNLALAYTIFRAVYPVFFLYAPFLVLVSTVPGYLICLYIYYQVLTQVAFASV